MLHPKLPEKRVKIKRLSIQFHTFSVLFLKFPPISWGHTHRSRNPSENLKIMSKFRRTRLRSPLLCNQALSNHLIVQIHKTEEKESNHLIRNAIQRVSLRRPSYKGQDLAVKRSTQKRILETSHQIPSGTCSPKKV